MTVLLSSHNMDEVERCHRITYVCMGQLLMSGTIRDIIAKVNLCTWQVKGDNLVMLAKQLEATPGIDLVISFFDTLHVSSKDHDAINNALQPYIKHRSYQWAPTESTLDDVFIWLSNKELNK